MVSVGRQRGDGGGGFCKGGAPPWKWHLQFRAGQPQETIVKLINCPVTQHVIHATLTLKRYLMIKMMCSGCSWRTAISNKTQAISLFVVCTLSCWVHSPWYGPNAPAKRSATCVIMSKCQKHVGQGVPRNTNDHCHETNQPTRMVSLESRSPLCCSHPLPPDLWVRPKSILCIPRICPMSYEHQNNQTHTTHSGRAHLQDPQWQSGMLPLQHAGTETCIRRVDYSGCLTRNSVRRWFSMRVVAVEYCTWAFLLEPHANEPSLRCGERWCQRRNMYHPGNNVRFLRFCPCQSILECFGEPCYRGGGDFSRRVVLAWYALSRAWGSGACIRSSHLLFLLPNMFQMWMWSSKASTACRHAAVSQAHFCHLEPLRESLISKHSFANHLYWTSTLVAEVPTTS